MCVANGARGNARSKVQESSPVRRLQPGAFSPLKGEISALVCRHQGRNHGIWSLCWRLLNLHGEKWSAERKTPAALI
ncbi:hypothetical protein APS_0288 [Acetobacter pasteurianus subsp. pasteurianus LMG 1262 = NBRC 106471]|nr:hypothetical protein APS_0288 [Acetobacter pasteurianus subsp. pasteurianus LMG 1262 = NBRC 106471]